jgi:TonB family protein
MELLSLNGPRSERVPRMTRTDALVISVALHLLLLLFVTVVPEHLPESLRALIAPGPATQTPGQAASSSAEPRRPESQPLNQPKIPLKFAYVKIPNDTAAPKNPSSPLLSDKNRRARQEMPTPKDTRLFSIDPHSQGDSLDRVKPDPSRPEGPESPDLPEPRPAGGNGGAAAGSASARSAKGGAGAASGPGTLAGKEPGRTPGREGGPGSPEPRTDQGIGSEGSGVSPDNLRQALHDLKAGEYKFTFNNPAYLRGGSYGTMSFDTQDFPWGDYARRLYVIIRNSWLSRIPLAAREGIRGYVCWRFVIEKDGSVSSIVMIRPSSIPPFDKAASDAIRASSPVPPLPANFPSPREGVTFCFFYNMSPGEAD